MVLNKLISFQLDYAPQYSLSKYISTRTRLQLVHINHQSSPLVQGYFAVATECSTDSGVPHTLEHLLFMGSKNHPYKGLLDNAGNLCMSSTNAWTATDQTVYTLTSAGWQGFKKLLPVYLDHLLNPTLTDEACLTEVYHVDPEDLSDKGVVFSEMDAIESQSWFITTLEKQRLLFSPGSGYRSETGGLTGNLRQLSSDEIRQFHESTYSPDNLCLIVSGNVPEDELLMIVQEWDDLLPTFDSDIRKRPFLDSKPSQIPPKLNKTIETKVEFPELDESQGELLFAWIGEQYHSHVENLAIELLLEYFTESALAPFTKELIEIRDPYANYTDYWTDDFMRTIINVGVHGVPTAKLEATKAKVLDIFCKHEIDMERMKQVLDNGKWDYILRCERNGDSVLSQAAITDFIYGEEDGSSLKKMLKDLSDFETLFKWNKYEWSQLQQRIFIDNHPAIVTATPSSKMYDRINNEKEELIKQRQQKYKDIGKAALRESLDRAILLNDKPIPDAILEQFLISNPEKSVDFINCKGITAIDKFKWNNKSDEITRQLLAYKPADFPLFIHLEHFPSQFVDLHFLLNSRCIKDTKLLPYYYIIREIFSLPMQDESGKIIPFEKVVSQLKSDTVESNISMGLQGSVPDLIDFNILCRAENYAKAAEWMKHCLFDMKFDENRVKLLLENYMDSLVEQKREGENMLESLTNRTLYSDRSVKKSTDALFVEERLEEILEIIESGGYEEKILPRLDTVRSQLRSNFSKFHILIMGDGAKLGPDIYSPWNVLIKKLEDLPRQYEVKVPPVPRLLDATSPLCKNPKGMAYVVTTPASESSYMNIFTSVPFNMDYHNPEYAIVSLACEYLQSVEGPFWRGIRGTGLAYGANMVRLAEANCWGFNVYRAADIVKCYHVAKEIVEQHASGELEINSSSLKGAVSMIINRIATYEHGYAEAGIANYRDNFLLNRGPHFNKSHIQRLAEVTVEDVKRILKKYLVNLFNSEKSVVFISCHPSKLESIEQFLESEGFIVEIEELDADDEDDEEDSEDDDGDCNGDDDHD